MLLKNVSGCDKFKILVIFQNLNDVADILQAVLAYVFLTGSLCVYSWLGNELTTQASILYGHF
jgi:hypothetical protein